MVSPAIFMAVAAFLLNVVLSRRIGTHRVTIETYHVGAGGVEFPERLPAKYHSESELTREVKPGKQQLDFALESK